MKENLLTYYQPYPVQLQPQPKNGFGVTALVLGIIALLMGFIPFVSLFTSIPLGLLGVIFGIIGLVRVSKRVATNKVMTIFGLIASALAILLALTSSIATGAFIGSLGSEDSTTTSAPVADGDSAKAQQEESELDAFPGQTEDDVVGKAGEELAIRGVKITASEVTPKNDTFGNLVCSKVVLKNDGDSEVSYNVFDWKLQYPSGDIKDQSISGGDSLNSGEIAPGGTAEGDVCFEDNGEDGQYILISEGLFSFSSERGAWITER